MRLHRSSFSKKLFLALSVFCGLTIIIFFQSCEELLVAPHQDSRPDEKPVIRLVAKVYDLDFYWTVAGDPRSSTPLKDSRMLEYSFHDRSLISISPMCGTCSAQCSIPEDLHQRMAALRKRAAICMTRFIDSEHADSDNGYSCMALALPTDGFLYTPAAGQKEYPPHGGVDLMGHPICNQPRVALCDEEDQKELDDIRAALIEAHSTGRCG